MKKLLLLALLIVGCGRYESSGNENERFDTWKGKTEYYLMYNGKMGWYTNEEWEQIDAIQTMDDPREKMDAEFIEPYKCDNPRCTKLHYRKKLPQ